MWQSSKKLENYTSDDGERMFPIGQMSARRSGAPGAVLIPHKTSRNRTMMATEPMEDNKMLRGCSRNQKKQVSGPVLRGPRGMSPGPLKDPAGRRGSSAPRGHCPCILQSSVLAFRD